MTKEGDSSYDQNVNRLGFKGTLAGNALAFKNPDGGRIVIVANPFKEPRTLSLQIGTESFSCELPVLSYDI